MNPELETAALHIAIRAITTALRRRARAPRNAQTGAVALNRDSPPSSKTASCEAA